MPALRVAVTDTLATLTLARPERYNALDVDLAQQLAASLIQLQSDPSVRAIVLTGAGEAFCAGGDLKWVTAHPRGLAAGFHELAAYVNVCVTEIRRMDKPVIAAINGVAAGGGFSLALACDFRVMATSARLRQGYTSNGLCIDGGGTFMLPRLVGLARALEIAAFDEPIDADRALAWGLVTRLAAPAAVVNDATAMARDLSRRSLSAFRLSKRLLTTSFETPLEAQLELERQGIAESAAHADGVEGVRAFLSKTAPRYAGAPGQD
jgi:2-(1,2-epoxy-1,2-dihydrophenyl)acetyl-CoA isomerase